MVLPTAQIDAANNAVEPAHQSLLQIDAGVGIEAEVFRRYERICEYGGDVRVVHGVSPIFRFRRLGVCRRV